MIRGVAEKTDGSNEFFIGLSAANIAALVEGLVLRLDATDSGFAPPGSTIVIFCGATDADVLEMIRASGLPMPPLVENDT